MNKVFEGVRPTIGFGKRRKAIGSDQKQGLDKA
jgi:hypothetical protein